MNCPICQKENRIVNECGCDPNNLPTTPAANCRKPHCHICNPAVITSEQFENLAARLQANNFPVRGQDAFLLWEWSNRTDIEAGLAMNEMEKLGYKPLVGFPLQRAR